MGITITGAVIVRNEERCIKRCIDSLITIFDEIIIVDTGSFDNTLNILNSYPSDKLKIFNTKWEDDFSKSRNIAIHEASCEYIFFVDADEYISSSKSEVISAFTDISRHAQKNKLALCPNIKDHDSNISRSVRRGFINNNDFYYFGYVHEELRNYNSEISDLNIKVDIIHDGYLLEVIEGKGKVKRNGILNLKNINIEPLYLRWRFFYYRDSFEFISAEEIYNTLSTLIKINGNLPLQISNLKSDQYIFPILDLMARAKLKLLDDENEFKCIITMMNEMIPDNSNAFYYSMIYDIYKWKESANKKIIDIVKYKKMESYNNIDMLHSEGLHIDATLSFYMYEIGMIANAKKLLLSVKSSGFNTGLIDNYLNLMSYKDNEHA